MKAKRNFKHVRSGMPWLTLLLASTPCLAIEAPEAAVPQDTGWPRDVTAAKAQMTLYQPQIDEWEGYRLLHARLAVSLKPAGEAPVLGVAEITGETTVDKEERSVLIRNIRVDDAHFSSVKPEDETRLVALLKDSFPVAPTTVSLDRVLANVKLSKESSHPVEVKMDPPPIFISTTPAMILMIEGKPVLAPIDNTTLKFVVNTNWDLLFDEASSSYYLLSGDEWLTAKEVAGPWTLADSIPAEFAKLPDDDTWQHVKHEVPWKVAKGMILPKVFYSDKPAELISFKGDPVWEKIEGTKLSFANNTESDVFQNEADGSIYYLVSGRWFKTTKIDEPWTYAGNNLPEDFSKIPEDGPCGDVLASVPGTEEAEDAVILASVPVEAVVHIKEAEAKAKASYQGAPEFKPIEGTQMQYAANTSSDVIEYHDKYYLCQDAVWFISTSATGPWAICKDVPDEIYSIPPSSPVYRVTYVNVEDDNDDNDDEVTCSYTAGYFGTFVAGLALGECLMWGTGYYYPPYVGWWGHYPAYYPYHYSYGCAAAYNRWTGGYAVGERVYGPYASAGRAAWYNPATGRYGRAAHVEGPYGGRTVAGAYNPRTGTGWVTHQGNNGYAQWGASAAHRGNRWVESAHVAGPNGGAAAWRGSNGAGTFHWSDEGHGGMAVHNGDFYAGHDGNVYRKDDGQWSKWENGGWQPAGHNADGYRPNPGPDRNGFISGQTRKNLPGYSGGVRPGQGGAGERNPAFENRPGAGGSGERNPAFENRPGAGGSGERNPALDNRPGAGGSGTRNPNLPARHVTDPGEVQNRLNRDAYARDRGEARTQQFNQQRSFNQGGGGFNRGGGGFNRGGGGFGGGGGGFSRGGGGFHRR
ncbi:hypothetical protein [Haloferula sp. BvORR071]|uniref:hypothetical protein n=1 Tax=Haloferula sp. BvORR071 TaxID=1396141 RepID=UPI00069735E9|nr:hypothetical protein [Haloferula sp. BvORR071]